MTIFDDMIVDTDQNMLENLIASEMIAMGLDPLNRDDVQEFWLFKGIKIDNADLFIQGQQDRS